MARGGARAGGGRPRKDPAEKAVTMAIVVAPDVRDALKAMAEARKISVSQLAQEFIRKGLRAAKQEQAAPE